MKNSLVPLGGIDAMTGILVGVGGKDSLTAEVTLSICVRQLCGQMSGFVLDALEGDGEVSTGEVTGFCMRGRSILSIYSIFATRITPALINAKGRNKE